MHPELWILYNLIFNRLSTPFFSYILCLRPLSLYLIFIDDNFDKELEQDYLNKRTVTKLQNHDKSLQVYKDCDSISWSWTITVKDCKDKFKMEILMNYRHHQPHRIQLICTFKFDNPIDDEWIFKINSLICELNSLEIDCIFALKTRQSGKGKAS